MGELGFGFDGYGGLTMSIKSLETLEVWNKAKGFALRVYREVLPLLPAEEKWNLNQQLRRSSNSVPANIAEGYGRFYYQETIRFCYNARGSLEETLSHLVLCFELKYIPKVLFDSLEQDGEKLTQLVNGYIGYLKRSKKGNQEPGVSRSSHEASARYEIDFSKIEYPAFPIPKSRITNHESRFPLSEVP
jgi:four helix bundle protein